MSEQALASIDVTVVGGTDNALRVTDGVNFVWVPTSQIHADSEVWEKSHVGVTATMVIPTWLAEKKGLV